MMVTVDSDMAAALQSNAICVFALHSRVRGPDQARRPTCSLAWRGRRPRSRPRTGTGSPRHGRRAGYGSGLPAHRVPDRIASTARARRAGRQPRRFVHGRSRRPAHLCGNRHGRLPARFMLTLIVGNQPHSIFAQFRREPVRRLARDARPAHELEPLANPSRHRPACRTPRHARLRRYYRITFNTYAR